MIGAIIGTVVKVVGAALAAKAVIDGIKNGNLLQAVVGGVGAYFAFSGLGAMTKTLQASLSGAGAAGGVNSAAALAQGATDLSAVATAGAADAGTNMMSAMTQGAGAQAGSNLLTEGLSSAAGSTVDKTGLLFSGAGEAAGGAAADLALGGASDLATQGATDVASSGMFDLAAGEAPIQEGLQVADPAAKKGLLSQALEFGKENPELMKMGGQALSGWAKAQQREKEIKRIMAERARERASRGASVDPSAVTMQF